MTTQHALPLDGYCHGPLFRPVQKRRPLTRPRGKEGVVHRAQTVRATPKWLTADDKRSIRGFYHRARRVTSETGQLHVVDHIVPKISPWVCGLHVPWNLQVLHWRENTDKANNHWPDMWAAQAELEL